MVMSKDPKSEILERLKSVSDPELGLDIVTLGFVRRAEFGPDGKVRVVMTLTTPLCPLQSEIAADVRKALRGLGEGEAEVEFSFDPPWEAPPEAKAILGL